MRANNRQSIGLGIITSSAGGLFLAPIIYRHKSIDWNHLFTYIFIAVGLFLLLIGVIAILQARRKDHGTQYEPQTISQPLVEPTEFCESVPSEDFPVIDGNASKTQDESGRSNYYKFAMVIGLLPLAPLVLLIFINTACSLFGVGLGFGCTHPGYGHAYWPELFAYLGTLGWLLSLPAWALLAFAGALLRIR